MRNKTGKHGGKENKRDKHSFINSQMVIVSRDKVISDNEETHG